ncbi:MAG: cobalamin B12-binding domain-containing protein [Chloroflexota bacterium]
MILLYNPPSSASQKPVMPMSLLALGAVLENKYDYMILDGNLHDDQYAAVEQAVIANNVDILGVTVMPGPQLSHAIPVCRALKAKFPHLKIIWGGYFPTQHYDVVLQADYVDYVVRGTVKKRLLRCWIFWNVAAFRWTSTAQPTATRTAAYRRPCPPTYRTRTTCRTFPITA